MRTLQMIYRQGKQQLAQAGIDTPAFDAMCLFEHSFGMDRQALLLYGDQPAGSPEQEQDFFALISRRAQRYPLQYLVGQWPFCDLSLCMGEGVLIAREDTAVLVQVAAEMIQTPQALVFDLCAGTGAVGLALAAQLPQIQVHCIEKYDAAFVYLQQNITRCKKQGIANVAVVQGDILQLNFAQQLPQPDAIVANPPYIETAELPALQEEVQHEPRTALDGGVDGLLFYRAIADLWLPKLKSGGVVAVEIGEQQEQAVAALFSAAGVSQFCFPKDSGGIIRVVAGIKQ